jgi:hypothetical protein
MNLHVRLDPPDPPYQDYDVPTCPDCGSQRFWRINSGAFTEQYTVNFTHQFNEDWDDLNQETYDSTRWQCENNHEVDDDLHDMIDESR